MDSLKKLLESLEPREALALIAAEVKKLFRHVNEQDRLDFVMRLIDDAGADKVASMVSL